MEEKGEGRKELREGERKRGEEKGIPLILRYCAMRPAVYVYAAVSSLQEERHCQNTTTPR